MAREGKRIRTAHLDVRTVASPLGACRVGFVVAKHRQTAVARNRLKRRLRELVRLRLLPGAPPVDLVIRTRPEAYGASFEALAKQIEKVAEQLRRSGVGRGASGAAPTETDTTTPKEA